MKNKIQDESYLFALDVVKFTKYLRFNKKEFVLADQLLKSGTSIGANIAESQSAVSNKDFIQKMSISLKEARESYYWLNLIRDSQIVDAEIIEDIYQRLDFIIGMLVKIIKSCKRKSQD